MKNKLILERVTHDLSKTSQETVSGHKEEIEIEISYVDTQDIKNLKKLQEEEIDIKNDIKILTKLEEKYLNIKDITKAPSIDKLRKEVGELQIDIKKDLKKLDIKDIKELEDINYRKIDNSQIRMINNIQDKQSELLKKQKDINSQIEIITIKYKVRLKASHTNLSDKVNELKKNFNAQEQLLDNISNNPNKTDEEVYNDIKNDSMFDLTSDRQVNDDGKFYATVTQLIQKPNSDVWVRSAAYVKTYTNIDDFMIFLGFERKRNFRMENLQQKKKLKLIIKTQNNSKAVKKNQRLTTVNNNLKRLNNYTKNLKTTVSTTKKRIDKLNTNYTNFNNQISTKIVKTSKKLMNDFNNVKSSIVSKFNNFFGKSKNSQSSNNDANSNIKKGK